MSLCRLLLALSVMPVLTGTPARAQDGGAAPCRLCNVEGAGDDDRPAIPLRLEVQARLEFDKVVFGGLGEAQVVLSPGGVATLSGATTAVGARAMPGSVLIRGEPGRAVRIDLPQDVQLVGANGGAIRIDRLVTDLPGFPRIGDDGTLAFRFGGALRISGDSDGAYRGSIDILVDYL